MDERALGSSPGLGKPQPSPSPNAGPHCLMVPSHGATQGAVKIAKWDQEISPVFLYSSFLALPVQYQAPGPSKGISSSFCCCFPELNQQGGSSFFSL